MDDYDPLEDAPCQGVKRKIDHVPEIKSDQKSGLEDDDVKAARHGAVGPNSWPNAAHGPEEIYPGDLLPNAHDPSGTCNRPVVFVWDLDETLILFNALLTGQYAGPGHSSKWTE